MLSYLPESPTGFDGRYYQPGESPIWMSDASWKRIDEVKKSDSIVGFARSNEPGLAQHKRKFVNSTVLEIFRCVSEVVTLEMESSAILRSTPEHHWYTGRNEERFQYMPPKVGRPIVRVAPIGLTLPETSDYQVGYMQGAAHGDGCFTDKIYTYEFGKSHVCNMRLAMNDVEALERFERFSALHGFESRRGAHDSGVYKMPCTRIYGKAAMEFLNETLAAR